MTVARVLICAFCALAAGVAVENAKARSTCGLAGVELCRSTALATAAQSPGN